MAGTPLPTEGASGRDDPARPLPSGPSGARVQSECPKFERDRRRGSRPAGSTLLRGNALRAAAKKFARQVKAAKPIIFCFTPTVDEKSGGRKPVPQSCGAPDAAPPDVAREASSTGVDESAEGSTSRARTREAGRLSTCIPATREFVSSRRARRVGVRIQREAEQTAVCIER